MLKDSVSYKIGEDQSISIPGRSCVGNYNSFLLRQFLVVKVDKEEKVNKIYAEKKCKVPHRRLNR